MAARQIKKDIKGQKVSICGSRAGGSRGGEEKNVQTTERQTLQIHWYCQNDGESE